MHDGKSTRNPVTNLRFRNDRSQTLLCNRRRNNMLWRRGSDLLSRAPEILRFVGSGSGIIRTGFVNDGDAQAFAVCLLLPRHIDMHSIEFAIAVGVKFRLDPQIVSNPVVIECRYNLCFAILKDRFCRLLGLRRGMDDRSNVKNYYSPNWTAPLFGRS